MQSSPMLTTSTLILLPPSTPSTGDSLETTLLFLFSGETSLESSETTPDDLSRGVSSMTFARFFRFFLGCTIRSVRSLPFCNGAGGGVLIGFCCVNKSLVADLVRIVFLLTEGEVANAQVPSDDRLGLGGGGLSLLPRYQKLTLLLDDC